MKTLKYIWKSIYSNVVILEEEQKWWLAIIIFLISLVATIGGTMYSGFTSTANGLISTTNDTAIDIGFSGFAKEFDKEGEIYIDNGELKISDDFANNTSNIYNMDSTNKTTFNAIVHDCTFSYTHFNDDKELTVFKVYVFTGDVNPTYVSDDNTFLTKFIQTSIYLLDDKSAATWTPYSFMILTPHSVHIAAYKIVGSTATTSATISVSGVFNDIDKFDFYSLGHDDNGANLTNTVIATNTLDIINRSYTTIRNKSVWYQTGIYTAINAGILIVSGLIFWLISRSKSSLIHYTFWQAEKIAVFMAFTPALITFVLSFFLSSYSSFVFLMIIALRMMSAVQRLSANKPSDSKPVYKARS